MTFSSKLRADYVELINEELDRIPVVGIEEFNLIAEELQILITPPFILALKGFFSCNPKKSTLTEAAQNQIAYIHYCYNTPKDFVTNTKDYSEYQQILKERISAKITEFQKFTEKEKNAYITFQREQHSEVKHTSFDLV
ncbi:hypothetical protein [Legionella parisiensis]|uniref:Uncharacterized protein n=1 Tax=Legionella parisiensis TaxID=45071 RepID=A0A1E5JPW4_9GAMM|nr:hypothetical protein [Legionella parisiensis]KTD44275.1 hypothetical protein Lpar_0361 [Legionella parisiensis]OEH46572.1 hypothetical protein lpari_02440 [Legionella parisiensis]STX71900.1 Uncharacterised protein [Legionella parisiensis]